MGENVRISLFCKFCVVFDLKSNIQVLFLQGLTHSYPEIFFCNGFLKLKEIFVRFNGSGPVLEQHCYPSSLKFDLVVVTRDGFLTASHLGIQRRVLNELACRPSSLVQPSQLYQICLMAGLAQVCQL